METKQLIELCDNADIAYRTYSGRGMYGKQCFAVESDNGPSDVILEIIHAAVQSDDFSKSELIDLLETLGDARTDSMGLGIVVYWPCLEMNEQPK